VAILLLTGMLGLLVASAYFSGTEAALFSLTRLQRHQLEARRDRASRRVHRLLEKPEATLAALLVGNNLVNIALASVSTAVLLALMADRGRAVRLASLLAMIAVLLFGEITPKTLAVRNSVASARLLSGSFLFVAKLLQPLTRACYGLAGLVLRALGLAAEAPRAQGLLTHAELRAVLQDFDDEGGAITPSENRLVQNILEFPRRTAQQIMTPRIDVVDLAVDAAPADIVQVMRTSRHSRYPVYEGESDNVIGFVQAKEYLLEPQQGLRGWLRPVAFFPEPAPVDRIFQEIQRSRTGLVVVVNEFGETAGLISREDVIEEIVGDIYDEFDREEAPVRKKGEGLYIVAGRMALQDLEELLPVELPDDSSVTLNGFLCEVHGRIPRPGTVIAWGGLRFHVLEVVRHQVHRVLVELPEPESGEDA
jgi:putative hemolysin